MTYHHDLILPAAFSSCFFGGLHLLAETVGSSHCVWLLMRDGIKELLCFCSLYQLNGSPLAHESKPRTVCLLLLLVWFSSEIALIRPGFRGTQRQGL